MNSTRYATTEYNRFKRLESRFRDVFSRAVAYHFTADKLTDEVNAVRQTADFRKVTTYYRGYLSGLCDAWRANIWQNHVVWMLGPAEGPTRRVHDPWTDEMSRLSESKQIYGGHYWTDNKGNPTAYPFTEYKNLSQSEAR